MSEPMTPSERKDALELAYGAGVLHEPTYKGSNEACVGCSRLWPCPTIRLARLAIEQAAELEAALADRNKTSQQVADEYAARCRAARAAQDMAEALQEAQAYFEGEHHPDHPTSRAIAAALAAYEKASHSPEGR
jgi:hypothetical protein